MALKERGIAVTETVRKGPSRYPPRLLQLKKVNRGLVWEALQASIIGGYVAGCGRILMQL
jgi:hypothetical protein